MGIKLLTNLYYYITSLDFGIRTISTLWFLVTVLELIARNVTSRVTGAVPAAVRERLPRLPVFTSVTTSPTVHIQRTHLHDMHGPL